MSTLALVGEETGLTMRKIRSNIKRMLPAIHTQFWFSASFSLMAPFFPTLASSKDVPPSQYGYVFSVFKLAMLIGSITSEMVMHRVSPESVYISGMLGQFIFGIALGSLYWCPIGAQFLILAMIFAAFGGHMGTWYSVSMYSIVTERFSAKTGVIISSMEFFWGLGNMFGSSIGGVLIDLWAFPLPFIVLGCIMILVLPIIIKQGPVGGTESDQVDSGTSDGNQDITDLNYKLLLLRPMFIINMISIVFSWIIMGFNEPTLEPYLRNTFGMSYTKVGFIFMVQFGSYAAGALISGFMWHIGQDVLFLFIAQSLTAVAFLVQGPSSIINAEPSVAFIIISQVCTGIGMAGQFVCGFAGALHVAVDAGYPDNLKTTGVVSSWTFTCLVLGAIVTPPIAAKLVETYGYRQGTVFIMIPLAIWALVNGAAWIYTLIRNRKSDSLPITVPLSQPINADSVLVASQNETNCKT